MKKVLSVLVFVTLFLIIAGTVANATTEAELEAYIKQTHIVSGKEVKLEADKLVKVERYLSTHEVTDEQATALKGKIDEAIALMNKAGVSDYTKLSTADKQKLLKIGQEAASKLGLTMTYNSSEARIEIYEGTTLLDSQSTIDDVLVQTGSNNIVFVVFAGLAIIAIAIATVIKKGRANA